ncbi:MAG: flagellar type III secretion system pore protein FliP [Opitutales bacterium]|nr:flagellar type III secretion system pore protein FliP [Opitutales bacterium]NRA26893.1 flagellar type III secretion system pore protein FliP [Opitutales bacterium]
MIKGFSTTAFIRTTRLFQVVAAALCRRADAFDNSKPTVTPKRPDGSNFLAKILLSALLGFALFAVPELSAQSGGPLSVNVEFGSDNNDFGMAIQIVILMTILTIAPSIVIMMTCFTRIVIVLGFVRTAMGVQTTPSNQIIIGLALFLTFFIMGPTLSTAYEMGLQPYTEGEITSKEAMQITSDQFRSFMMLHTRPDDIEFMLGLSGLGPTAVSEIPMRVIIPSFMLSELRTAFQMGFLLFIPFLVIDFMVASTLMAMGMMMMPPIIVSLPFKLLLFVLVDGWALIVQSIVQSFQI